MFDLEWNERNFFENFVSDKVQLFRVEWNLEMAWKVSDFQLIESTLGELNFEVWQFMGSFQID
jgi:hypothetical protein